MAEWLARELRLLSDERDWLEMDITEDVIAELTTEEREMLAELRLAGVLELVELHRLPVTVGMVALVPPFVP